MVKSSALRVIAVNDGSLLRKGSTRLIQRARLGLAARPFTSWRHRRPVFSPRIGTCGVRIPDAYRHRCKALGKPRFTANRPPVVQENLERAPHGYPATDRKAFTNDLANTAVFHQRSQEIAQCN